MKSLADQIPNPAMATPDADERARQDFAFTFRNYVTGELMPSVHQLYATKIEPAFRHASHLRSQCFSLLANRLLLARAATRIGIGVGPAAGHEHRLHARQPFFQALLGHGKHVGIESRDPRQGLDDTDPLDGCRSSSDLRMSLGS